MSDCVVILRIIFVVLFFFERILIVDNCLLVLNVLKLMSGNNLCIKEMFKWLLKIENSGKVIVLELFSVCKKWFGLNIFVFNFRSLFKIVKNCVNCFF